MNESPHLLHVFPTFVAGGSQMRTVRLMDAFGAEFRHSVLALDGVTDARELVGAGVSLELVAAPPKSGSAATIRNLRRVFRHVRPDLVCTYNWGAIDAVIAARSPGVRIPVIHHEDGFGSDEADGLKQRRVWMRRLVLPATDAVIVPSFTLAEIGAERWRLGPERLFRIANGVRVGDFEPADGNAELRAKLAIPDGAAIVGFVGHLRAEKNLVRLVEAFARLSSERETFLLVLGDGPERSAVEAAVRNAKLADRVRLVGHREDLAPWYRAMDVFAIPSNTEQMPVALLEAMAARLPVASTDVGDVARILPEEQRAYLSARDPGALASALDALLADPDGARALGESNFAHVRATYSFEGMLDAYRDRYARALSR